METYAEIKIRNVCLGFVQLSVALPGVKSWATVSDAPWDPLVDN